MSAFDRSLRSFPVSAVLLSGILAGIAGSDSDSVSAQESPVTGSSFSTATSVHDDKRVTNAVLQNSMSEARSLGETQRGWKAANGKLASRADGVVSLQSADARRGAPVARSRRSKPATVPTPGPVFMVSAGRPVIPPVPEPVRENAGPEDLEAVELAPVEPPSTPATPEKSASEPSLTELPAPEPSAADVIPGQQPAATVTPPPVAQAPASSQDTSDRPVLSATERFKLALEEERRRVLAEQAAAKEETPVLPSLDGGAVDMAPVEDMPPEQLPSQDDLREPSEIPIDDPEMRLQDEKARRFIRLKQQLMQLKSQLEQPVATDPSESQPPSADKLHSDPQESHAAPDKEPGLDGHSEELLPPVDGQESPETSHPETEGHATDHGDHGPAPHDASGQSDSADAVTGHPAAPHDHDPENGGHESDLNAGEPSASEDGHQTKNSHIESGANGHSATENAPHAASEHAVVHGPIDRLGLANNLYAVGEYQLAMKMYEQTEMAELTAQQQIWTDYQMANCLRRMGRNAEASNRYRRIADQPEAGWLSEQSRWWVDVLEQIRQLQSSLEEDAGNSEENLQSPFAGVQRDSDSSGNVTGQSGSKKSGSGSTKSGSTKSGKGSQPSGSNNDDAHGPSATSSSSQTSSRTGKPAEERITHFAPAVKEPKHGEH
jgi:hypothetical protein